MTARTGALCCLRPFLITDELISTTVKIMKGLQIDETAIDRNLANYAPFAATERLLVALSKKGADRQVIHETLRRLSNAAWEALRQGNGNPLIDLVCKEKDFLEYCSESELRALMDISRYTGFAPQRARAIAQAIHLL